MLEQEFGPSFSTNRTVGVGVDAIAKCPCCPSGNRYSEYWSLLTQDGHVGPGQRFDGEDLGTSEVGEVATRASPHHVGEMGCDLGGFDGLEDESPGYDGDWWFRHLGRYESDEVVELCGADDAESGRARADHFLYLELCSVVREGMVVDADNGHEYEVTFSEKWEKPPRSCPVNPLRVGRVGSQMDNGVCRFDRPVKTFTGFDVDHNAV